MNWINDDFCKLIQRKFPLIQAPMFGVTTPEMVAATNKANCLGTLALGDLDADKSIEQIRKTKNLTKDHFAVNIFVHHIPEITKELENQYQITKSFIENLASENQLEVELPNIHDLKINSYHEQIQAIIAEGCKILSFTFGNLDSKSIDLLKAHDVALIGTCTSVNEALILEKSGIDLICVQGWEAGGHRGSFDADNIPKIGGLSLLSQVHDSVQIPIIYAGGLYNSQTIKAAKMLGVSGFQIGSLLLNSKESALQDFERNRLKSVKENEIILTKSFSGRFARGIENLFMKALDQSDYILPYPYQNKITASLRKAAKQTKNADFTNIWIGQSIPDFSNETTTEILSDLINQLNLDA